MGKARSGARDDVPAGFSGVLDRGVGELIVDEGVELDTLRKLAASPLGGLVDQVFSGVVIGEYEGYQVLLHPHFSGGRDRSDPAVMLRLFWDQSLGFGLRIYREGFWSRVGRTLGAQDLTSGDDELDGLVVIKATDVEGAAALLASADLRRALLALYRASDRHEVGDRGIVHRESGELIAPDRVRELLDDMLPVAQRISPRSSYRG
jgi:hypothetical protein